MLFRSVSMIFISSSVWTREYEGEMKGFFPLSTLTWLLLKEEGECPQAGNPERDRSL